MARPVRNLPLSESYIDNEDREWKREEILEKAREIAEAEPERIITRNRFRVSSGVPERAWRHLFGRWETLKAQAGIIVPRPVKRLEDQISKHVNADHYRAMSKEAASWGERYLRPSGKRFQTILVAGDFHDVNCDPFALRVWLDTAKRLQPDIVCFLGDIFDNPQFSRYTIDARTWNVVERYNTVHNAIFGPTRKAAPNAQFDFLGGNHERRILRHLADATPVMKAVLADIHGWTLPKLLGLEQHSMNFIHRGDLACWNPVDDRKETLRNYQTYFDCFIATHETKDGLRKHCPGVSGHQHKFQSWPFDSPQFGSYSWVQLGAMCARCVDWTDAERWSIGFEIVHIDTKKKFVQQEYVDVRESFVCVGGKYYFRDANEKVIIGPVKN